MKVGASIYQTPDLKQNPGWGGGGFRATKKKPGYATDVKAAVTGQE